LWDFCWTRWQWEKFFSEEFCFLQVSITYTNVPYLASCTFCSYQKDKWAKPGNFKKSWALSLIGKHWAENGLQLSCTQLVFTVRITRDTVWRKAEFLYITSSGTYSYHFALNG